MSRSRLVKLAACCAVPMAALWWSVPAVGADASIASPEAAAAVALPASAAASAPVLAPPTAEFLALQTLARAGDRQAQFDLGKAYELGQGSGRARDLDAALPWYLKAAEQNHAEAQSRLGAYYEAADKPEEALRWLEKAAAQGHARATNKLASMHDFGQGVSKDGRKAVELYEKAADLGWPEAMWNLANIYGAGRYGPSDRDQACVWTLRAQKYAEPHFPGVLKQVDKRLPGLNRSFNAERMARCREVAESWTPKQIAVPVTAAAAMPASAPASAAH